MSASIRWFFRELSWEFALLALMLSLALVPSSAFAQSLYQTQTIEPSITAPCTNPAPTDNPATPQWVAAGDVWFFGQETVHYYDLSPLIAAGYDHLVGMINATTMYPCSRGKPGSFGLNALRLEYFNPQNGSWVEAQVVTFGRGYDRPDGLRSGIWYREPYWFTSGQPSTQSDLVTIAKQTYTVDLAPITKGIFHAWTNPRLKLLPGYKYRIRAVVTLQGDGCFQIGLDAWKGANSPDLGYGVNNIQVALSDWLCGTKKQTTMILSQQ